MGPGGRVGRSLCARRLEKRIYISLPTEIGRKELFRINLGHVEVDDGVDLDLLSDLTKGYYSGADVAVVCRDAAMMSVRRIVKGALEKGLSGAEIQEHVLTMKDELSDTITMDDFRCLWRRCQSRWVRRNSTSTKGGRKSSAPPSFQYTTRRPPPDAEDDSTVQYNSRGAPLIQWSHFFGRSLVPGSIIK